MATVMFTNDDRLIYKVFAIHLSLKYTEILSKHSNRTYKHDTQFLVMVSSKTGRTPENTQGVTNSQKGVRISKSFFTDCSIIPYIITIRNIFSTKQNKKCEK